MGRIPLPAQGRGETQKLGGDIPQFITFSEAERLLFPLAVVHFGADKLVCLGGASG